MNLKPELAEMILRYPATNVVRLREAVAESGLILSVKEAREIVRKVVENEMTATFSVTEPHKITSVTLL